MSSTLSMVNKEHVMTKLKRRRFPFKKLTSIVEYIFLLSLSFFPFFVATKPEEIASHRSSCEHLYLCSFQYEFVERFKEENNEKSPSS